MKCQAVATYWGSDKTHVGLVDLFFERISTIFLNTIEDEFNIVFHKCTVIEYILVVWMEGPVWSLCSFGQANSQENDCFTPMLMDNNIMDKSWGS